MKVYGDYTQEDLDRQYDQAALVPNIEDYEKENRARSAEARKRLRCRLNVPYGPTLDEVLDIFPAGGTVVCFLSDLIPPGCSPPPAGVSA